MTVLRVLLTSLQKGKLLVLAEYSMGMLADTKKIRLTGRLWFWSLE